VSSSRPSAVLDQNHYKAVVESLISEGRRLQCEGQCAQAASCFTNAAAECRACAKQYAQSTLVKGIWNDKAEECARAAYELERLAKAPGGVIVETDVAGTAVVAPQTNSGANEAARAVQELRVAEKPAVTWDDIIGLQDAKGSVREAVELPLKFSKLFEQLDLEPWNGILLFGPPGTGKTMLAQAAANEMDCTFYAVSCSKIFDKNFGSSEKIVAELFADAQRHAPAIIYLDECDSILRARSGEDHEASLRIKTEFFVAMQGFKKNSGVLVIASTNCPGKLDKAAARRFDKHIWVGPPDEEARVAMFKRKLAKVRHKLTEADFAELARRTDCYTGDDIAKALKQAKFIEFRRIAYAPAFVRGENGNLVPCDARIPGSFALPKQTADTEFAADVTFDQVLQAVLSRPPVVNREALQEYIDGFAQSMDVK
jgi:vacuolar protein-sorting-associated protein 4